MWKKMLLSLAAVCFTALSAVNVCWEVRVNRHMVPGLFSSEQIRKCCEAAEAASEEILPGSYVPPLIEKSCRFSLRPPRGSEKLLTHSMILSSDGIVSADGVFANGIPIGTVEDGGVLLEKLREYIKNQMPNCAVFGSINGRVAIMPLYSRRGSETPYGDMLLLISGIAPVFYVDSEGQPA